MHIVIFVDYHDSAIGGVPTSVRGQRRGLELLGHKVTIVSPPPTRGKDISSGSVIVPAVPFIRPNGFPMVLPSRHNMLRIEAALNKRGPIDIIHVQTNLGIGMLGVRIAKKRSIPLVQTMHGRDDVFVEDTFPFPYIVTSVLRLLHQRSIPHESTVYKMGASKAGYNAWRIMVNQAQAADVVVMPSHHFAIKFKEHGVTRPIEVISNGISDGVVDKLPKKMRRLKGTANSLNVMWCGRISVEKRPLESVEAVSRLKRAKLDIYGIGSLEESVKTYFKEHGLSKRFHLKGQVGQEEVIAAMQKHDILLYPSYGFDNQPMVLIEAVAAGIPVVYCDPDLTECMPKGGGLLTDDKSVDAIEGALTQLQDNPAQLQKMYKVMFDNRSKIAQSYHSKKMVALYTRLIR